METELKSLRIDRSSRRNDGPSPWATRWIIGGVTLLLLLGIARFAYSKLNAPLEVDTVRVKSIAPLGGQAGNTVILNATGYIVAAHKIEVAAKVIGRVQWIGVDKGYKVKQGDIIVRLEDDEYRAQLQQAKGNLASLEAKLQEAQNGSRPEEIARALADLNVGKADLENFRVTLERTKGLVNEKVLSKQALDDANAKYDGQAARVNSLQRTYDLAKLGTRQEQIDSLRGQVEQARGSVAYYETQLQNTVIRAPVTGTILERAVEKGEFVTTSFVGDRGAKGYVVSLADLNDLQVELDINQNDFAKLSPKQKGIITTDAYKDKQWEGIIYEISPEANRQKATVQVKVKVLNPDEYLRPEMNASVAFYDEGTATPAASAAKPVIYIPPGAVRNDAVFVIFEGKAVRRAVKTGGVSTQGLRIDDGLIGGEDLILNPPADMKDGDRVRPKQG